MPVARGGAAGPAIIGINLKRFWAHEGFDRINLRKQPVLVFRVGGLEASPGFEPR
jgi:hypothetical protein